MTDPGGGIVNKIKKTGGFTLIEILVAVMVGGILISAIYQIMVNQNRVYIVEEQNIEIEQSARAALDFMARELRLAGFGVADDEDANTNVFVDLINNAGVSTDGVDPGTDAIIFTAGVGQSSWVAKPTDAEKNTNSVFVYPAADKGLDFQKGTDHNPTTVDLIAYFLGEKRRLNTEPLIIDSVDYPKPTDDEQLTIITFTKDLCEVVIAEAKGSGLIQGDQVAQCHQTIRYSVQAGALTRSVRDHDGDPWSVQTLINNVEDLQLSYCFDDTDDDHKADMDFPANADDPPPSTIWANDDDSSGVLDEKVLPCGETDMLDSVVAYRGNVVMADMNVPKKTGDPSYNPLRGVKVNLVVRSSRQNPDHRFRKLFKPLAVQDHDPAASSKDGYRRRVFEREIPFRNLGLNPSFTNNDEYGDGDEYSGDAAISG